MYLFTAALNWSFAYISLVTLGCGSSLVPRASFTLTSGRKTRVMMNWMYSYGRYMPADMKKAPDHACAVSDLDTSLGKGQ